jgi:hypothetical protein
MGSVVSVTPRPRCTPGERTPGIHYTGDWVGPRVRLDTEGRGKTAWLCRRSNLDRPVVQAVSRHYSDWAFTSITGWNLRTNVSKIQKWKIGFMARFESIVGSIRTLNSLSHCRVGTLLVAISISPVYYFIIIFGSTALRGPWPSSEASASWSIRLLLLQISWQASFPAWACQPHAQPRLFSRVDVFCQGCLP